MAVFVNFGALVVNAMENNAGVFFGENSQSFWDSHSKNNQPMGQIFGELNCITVPLNINNDQDLTDIPVFDPRIGNLTPSNTKVF